VNYFKHETALIDEGAVVGNNTKIWSNSHVCGNAKVGNNCNIGQNVFIDNHAVVGNHCKLQNDVNVYDGVTLEDYVFCGPAMTFTNVTVPRCLYPTDRMNYAKTLVKYGASIGANATVVCGVTIGRHAMVGSGSVVTKDVKDYALIAGNPAKQIGWVCECGKRLGADLICKNCGRRFTESPNGLIEK
jgi:UDP-2-acetamido-3-amino-2,3-dideoxy-glucuronate N-acetyltransferase